MTSAQLHIVCIILGVAIGGGAAMAIFGRLTFGGW